VRQGAFRCARYDPDVIAGSQDVLTPIVDQDDLYTYLTGLQQQRLSLYRRSSRPTRSTRCTSQPDRFAAKRCATAFSDRVLHVDVDIIVNVDERAIPSVHVHGDVHGHGAEVYCRTSARFSTAC